MVTSGGRATSCMTHPAEATLCYLKDWKAPVVRIEEDGPRDSAIQTTFRAKPVIAQKPAIAPQPGEKLTTNGGGY
jgi:hypothetical protein